MAQFNIVVLICAIIPLVACQCTKEIAGFQFKRSVYEFSVELFKRIATDSEAHFVSSTLSPWILLATIHYGAADETLDELKTVLKLHGHRCFNNKYMQIAKEVTASDPQVTIERSSAIFIDESMELREGYKRKVASIGITDISPIAFNDFATSAALINNYVNRATHGIVEEIVTPDDLGGVYMILVDALYFRGLWEKSFHKGHTEQSTFYDINGNNAGNVNLMYNKGVYNITAIGLIGAKILELPYGDSERFSMLIFLPENGVSVYNVINSLKKISLTSIFTLYREYGPTTAEVHIPRFKISSDIDNLKELLEDMGLRDTFDSTRAKFPNISKFSTYVSSFIQKADIEVTEEGTVAASVTELGLSGRSSDSEEFVVNKPFFFMIVDRQALVPLFGGAYSKPSDF